MRFKGLVLGVLALMLVSGTGLSGENPLVVATNAQAGDFAAQIGGDRIEVYTIIPAGVCPAHYDVRPSDVSAVGRAALILYDGREPWLDQLITKSGNEEVRKVVVGIAYSPPQAMDRGEVISQILSEIAPGSAEYFNQNGQAYQASLEETAAELMEEAHRLQVNETNVLSMRWQAEFVGWLGFNVVETYGPEELLSMRDLAELAAVGSEQNVALVIDNLQSGINFGAKLAYEIGAVHVVLTNFPGATPSTATYREMIRYNADQLFAALRTYRGGRE